MAEILGNNIGAPAVPFTTDDDYPTHFAIYGNGGLRTVADSAARDAIKPKRRDWLMIVRLLNDGTSWELVPGLVSNNLADNGNWRPWPWFAAGAVAAGTPAGPLLEQLQWLAANGGGSTSPTAYSKKLTGPEDGALGVTIKTAAGSTVEYNEVTSGSGTAMLMSVRLGGSEVLRITFWERFLGAPLRFTHNGTKYNLTFKNEIVNL